MAQATAQATAALASQTAAATSAQSAQGYSVSAGTSADTATTQAASAASSATSASNSATNASSSASSASSSATSASTSASNAATSATNASNSATSAAGSASSASTYATNAASSATAAANSASDAAATLANALTKSDNLASLSNKSTSRSNLGVAIGSDVQAWDADLDAIAAISSTSGLLKKTAANTWSLDTTSYLSGTVGLANGGTGATDATGARTALGLGTAATAAATSFAQVANNLSDLVSASTARSNLGLGSVATLASTAVLQSANNLSDLGNVTTARTNLGLSALATTTPGTGVATALGVNTGTAGAFVVNGSALGTPASGNLANCTFPTLNQNTTGTAANVTGTVAVANGGTGLTSLTSTHIPYATATNTLGTSANLTFNGGRLDVASSTANPLFAVNATGTQDGSIQLLRSGSLIGALYINNSGEFFIRQHTSNILGFQTNGTERMRIASDGSVTWGNSGSGYLMSLTSGGNLGLGVTPSAASLPTIQSAYGLFTGNSEAHICRNAYFSGGWKYQNASTATRASQAGGEFQWYTAPSGSAGSAISFTQAMTLDASGALAIGTTGGLNASARLRVLAPSNASAAQELYTPGTNYVTKLLFANDWSSAAIAADKGALAFYFNGYASGNEGMRLTEYGNLLVGTTSANGGRVVIGGYTDGGLYGMVMRPSGDTASPISFRNAANSVVGQIQTTASDTTYTTSSDISLKENITPADSSLASILAFPVDQFDWKVGGHTDYGCVAQKAINYAPEIVTQGDIWGVDYGRITPRLIKAFQELAAKVAELEEKLNG